VTGGYSGVGFELCQILYKHNATVYIAGRSESKASSAISNIKKASPKSSGRLEFLLIDLSDFSTIKSGIEAFTAQQQRLDVLVNNAGVSGIASPPRKTRKYFHRCRLTDVFKCAAYRSC
jgi:retinol dehydrogenase 12